MNVMNINEKGRKHKSAHAISAGAGPAHNRRKKGKRLPAILLLACLAVCPARADSVEPIPANVTHNSLFRFLGNGAVCVEGTYPVVTLQEEGHTRLEAAILAYNWSLLARANREADAFALEAKHLSKEGKFGAFAFNTDDKARIMRSDARVFSVLEEHVSSGEQELPDISYRTRNIDAKSGHEIGLWEALADTGHLAEYIDEAIHRSIDIEKEGFYYTDLVPEIEKCLRAEEDMPAGFCFTLGYEGVTFTFDPYVLAPYSVGAVRVTLPYEDYAYIVAEEYRQCADYYIIPLFAGEKMPLGAYRSRLFSWTYGEGDEENLSVCLTLGDQAGDVTLSEEFIIYGSDPSGSLVKEDGRYYLYLEVTGENGKRMTHIFSITSDGEIRPPLLSDRYLGDRSETDPEHMTLYGTGILLGNYVISRTFHVGHDGLPLPNDPFDRIEGGNLAPLVLSQELTVSIVDERTGGRKDSERLPAGTFLTFLRTDNQTFVDMTLSDGRVCRIYVSSYDGGQTIEGIPAEEVFEGLTLEKKKAVLQSRKENALQMDPGGSEEEGVEIYMEEAEEDFDMIAEEVAVG